MAKKATKPAAPEYTCKDCAHSENWHNIGADGQPIFCNCKFQKWCKFLKYDYCEHFKKNNPEWQSVKRQPVFRFKDST